MPAPVNATPARVPARTPAASQFPDKVFIIKRIATSEPRSASDHGSDNDHPISSGLGNISQEDLMPCQR